jgi:hypothetical protein
MTRRFTEWLGQKWRRRTDPRLKRAYLVTFSTIEGQLVLRDFMDEVYCQTCPSLDPYALAEHNGQRKFVQRILEAMDEESYPAKYTYTEELTHAH